MVACVCLFLGFGRFVVGVGVLQIGLGYLWCFAAMCMVLARALWELFRLSCSGSGLCYSLVPSVGSFCILCDPCSSRARSGACFGELNSF